MTLQRIQITNIKGISLKTFSLNIIPNKPSILVAPNGFGKSSLGTGFSSLNNNRILLSEENYHLNNGANLPRIEIDFLESPGVVHNLFADNGHNTIKDHFDYFVINSQVHAKAKRQTYNGVTQVSASMDIHPISLIDSIPATNHHQYNITDMRNGFGENGKILPNLTDYLSNAKFNDALIQNNIWLARSSGQRIQTKIQQFKDRVNALVGTAENLLQHIDDQEILFLNGTNYLSELADCISHFDFGFTHPAQNFLAAYQIFELYNADINHFKNAAAYKSYLGEKHEYEESFRAFNSTWKNIRPREVNGKLIVEFPKARDISNGQRDVLCFVALLEKAKRKLKKNNSILIIDEVFDYLDDANLISVQYYISNFVETYRQAGKKLYPLILTHINPIFFKTFAFSNQKVYFLDVRTALTNQSFVRLLQNRENPTIENDVSKFLFHYNPGTINKRAEFTALGLRPTWGENNNFQNFISTEKDKYLNNQNDYDPFSICCAVRVEIERKIYAQIGDAGHQTTFLNTHKTKSKLEFAETLGISVPEYYYLLGIIYNDGMHWRLHGDNESPIISKLQNETIRHLILKVFS